ncbi:MAG: hypothetical protein OHK0046_19230 [Anaerolineae bacterium]
MMDVKLYLIEQLSSSKDRLVLSANFPKFTPQRLFDYFTQPRLLKKWWIVEGEAQIQPEGAYHFRWPEQNLSLRGSYKALERGKLVAFTWRWEHEAHRPETQVTIVLFPSNQGGTDIILSHGFYTDDEAGEQERTEHLAGWSHFLSQLQAYSPE